MSSFDLIVRDGTVVTADRLTIADVGIADGLIAAVAPELAGSAITEIDASGLTVFPGGVDPRVHLNDPGTDWEGFASGTAAFAAGGGTCLFDMPLNASPPTLDGASFDLKVETARGRAYADFCLWGGLVPGDLDRLDELAQRGVIGFKAFMCNTGMEEFPAADDLTLFEGMARAAQLGLPVAVHAESDAITMGLTERARRGGRTTMRDYLDSRPAVAELEAVGRAILLAGETGCSLHVVHVSTAAAAVLIAEARRGVSTSAARRARSTSCSPTRTPSGSVRSRSARLRFDPGTRSRRCGPRCSRVTSPWSRPTTRPLTRAQAGRRRVRMVGWHLRRADTARHGRRRRDGARAGAVGCCPADGKRSCRPLLADLEGPARGRP